jgi:tRNA (guanine37-N1)-methyltransferase
VCVKELTAKFVTMKQEKLEQKVRELFERQGFDIEKHSNIFQVEKDGERLILTVFSSEEYSLEDIEQAVSDGEKVFVDEELEEVQVMVENQVSVLREKDDEEYDLPSYELIGEIAVINELTVEEDEAVEGILKHHPSVKTILLKEEPLNGEFRVGEYSKLYGEETKTIHKEFGCRFKVDPTLAFFSEREGTERKRMLDEVEKDEKIFVMFCGVGPYPVILASKKDVDVTGIEKNPEAVKFARQNVKLNNLEDSVEIIEGDVADLAPELDTFDRILMPSPTNAEEFLDEALSVSESGTYITLYGISGEEELFDYYIDQVEFSAKRHGFGFDIISNRLVSDISPAKKKVAINFRIK